MKAVIQAGGIGSSLQPVTFEIPKPLLPVKKRPIINHLITFLKTHGISEFAIVVDATRKEDYGRWLKSWEKDLPVKNIRLFYENEPQGTFGYLRNLKKWIGDSTFLLTGADVLMNFNLGMVKKFHQKQKTIATIPLVFVKNPRDFGVPLLDGPRIKKFIEKPRNPHSYYVSAGLYIVEPRIFEYDDPTKKFVMIEKDIFPKIAKNGQLSGIKIRDARFYECGTLERWEKAIKEW